MKQKLLLVFLLVIFVLQIPAYQLINYKVKPGDTLYNIARDHGVSISTILDYNDINNPRNLRAGSSIVFPQPDGLLYTVKPGDSMAYIAKLFFAPVDRLLAANNMSSRDVIHPGQTVFIPGSIINMYQYIPVTRSFRWPVYGMISSYYGWRTHPISQEMSFHCGLDMAAPEGAPIFAAASGVVTFASKYGGYGLMVELEHDNGMKTRYAHMSHISVYEGQRVLTGSLIGRVGSTGVSTGPHLHFEVLDSEYRSYDPIGHLPARDLMYVISTHDQQKTGAGGN